MKKLGCILICFAVIHLAQAQVITTGNGTGPIPDDDPSGIVVSFPVSGLTAPIDSVSLSVTMNHTWVGDLKVHLQAPDGIARIVVFDSTGYKRSGSTGQTVNLGGTYTFSDLAANDWWATATGQLTAFVMPSGEYRSSTAGAYNDSEGSYSDFGGCTTRMDGAFHGLAAAQGNGTWTLSVVDQFGGDTGNITSAVLTINEDNNADLIFADNFDGVSYTAFNQLAASNVLGNCKKSRFDFSGNGLADFAVAEDDNGDILWTIQNNDTTTAGAIESFYLGKSATDFLMEGDMDGDGIKDPIVWRGSPAGEVAYYVRRSSRPNDAILKFVLGQANDMPTQIGDYDGDGIEDFALYRAPSSTGLTQIIIHESSTGTFRSIPMVAGTFNTVFSASGYDYTGDGIADAAIQRTSTTNAGIGEHLIFDGSTNILVDSYEFGNNTDLLIPGNYLGSDSADTNLGRSSSGDRNWYTRETGPGTEIGPYTLGTTGDFTLSGDYDGDGYDDYAVYDTSGTPAKIIVRPSSATSTLIEVNIGISGFYPIANSRVQ